MATSITVYTYISNFQGEKRLNLRFPYTWLMTRTSTTCWTVRCLSYLHTQYFGKWCIFHYENSVQLPTGDLNTLTKLIIQITWKEWGQHRTNISTHLQWCSWIHQGFQVFEHHTPSSRWPSLGWSDPSLCPDGKLATLPPSFLSHSNLERVSEASGVLQKALLLFSPCMLKALSRDRAAKSLQPLLASILLSSCLADNH